VAVDPSRLLVISAWRKERVMYNKRSLLLRGGACNKGYALSNNRVLQSPFCETGCVGTREKGILCRSICIPIHRQVLRHFSTAVYRCVAGLDPSTAAIIKATQFNANLNTNVTNVDAHGKSLITMCNRVFRLVKSFGVAMSFF